MAIKHIAVKHLIGVNLNRKKRECRAVNTPYGPSFISRRLVVTCMLTSLKFLIDTGSYVSVLPASYYPNIVCTDLILFLADGRKITTYGTNRLTVDFGLGKLFTFDFIIADVTRPILSTDFMYTFQLFLDLCTCRLRSLVTLTKLTYK